MPLPDGNRACQCERRERKAEIDPGPVSFSILWQHEQMGDDPNTGNQSQHHPDKVAWGLEHGPNCFDLGSADPHCHDQKGADEDRAQCYGRNSQSDRYVLVRKRRVREALRERPAGRESSSLLSLPVHEMVREFDPHVSSMQPRQ